MYVWFCIVMIMEGVILYCDDNGCDFVCDEMEGVILDNVIMDDNGMEGVILYCDIMEGVIFYCDNGRVILYCDDNGRCDYVLGW